VARRSHRTWHPCQTLLRHLGGEPLLPLECQGTDLSYHGILYPWLIMSRSGPVSASTGSSTLEASWLLPPKWFHVLKSYGIVSFSVGKQLAKSQLACLTMSCLFPPDAACHCRLMLQAIIVLRQCVELPVLASKSGSMRCGQFVEPHLDLAFI
jgi:hypothetical protein